MKATTLRNLTMPEITEISASYSRKVQLDDFEPIRHHVELAAVLEDGEDVDEAYDDLADRAEDMVERSIASRVAATKLAGDE